MISSTEGEGGRREEKEEERRAEEEEERSSYLVTSTRTGIHSLKPIPEGEGCEVVELGLLDLEEGLLVHLLRCFPRELLVVGLPVQLHNN